jgi:hypothetical protein
VIERMDAAENFKFEISNLKFASTPPINIHAAGVSWGFAFVCGTW